MDALFGHIVEGLKWLIAIVVAGVTWLYQADRKETKQHRDMHERRIAALEASRPERGELKEAISGIREELRGDLTAFREDVNKRLDLMIVILKGK